MKNKNIENLKAKYTELLALHRKNYEYYQRQYNTLAWIRLLVILVAGVGIYLYFSKENIYFLIGGMGCFLLFFILMRKHQNIAYAKKLEKIRIRINQNELDYLEGKGLPFDNGEEFRPEAHFYANDLDLFGEKSLYQHLNRAGTFAGKQILTHHLLNLPSSEEILPTQNAIKELTDKINWRQEVQSLAIYTNDNQSDEENLKHWTKEDNKPIAKGLNILSYVLPVAFIMCLVLSFIPNLGYFGKISGGLFSLNLIIALSQFKRIQKILTSSDKIDEIIRNYASIFAKVSNEDFQSKKLKSLQKNLQSREGTADKQLQKLSSLFGKMDSIQNIFAMILLNGIFLFHLHTFRKLLKWKQTHGQKIECWMDTLGTIEMLNSLSNFAYNNPDYAYPTLSENVKITFKEVGHPLLSKSGRVCNDISFDEQKFVILTGSNMSGKSTFLRTLGINMILARLGVSVCAKKAEIYPLDILVSMRLSDSLSDSESYFFAEVKRLKSIADELEKRKCFVLLDEILRGTNSDDKRNGTMGYVRKLVAQNVVGIVATHDLEVCCVQEEYPNYISNYYFDAGIVNDELYFDYTLKKGICQSKSASFLMKKMGVIE